MKRADATQAVLYVRVSTEEQATEGVSLEAQETSLRAYCAMRGLEVAELVIDAGVSAGKPLATREGGRRCRRSWHEKGGGRGRVEARPPVSGRLRLPRRHPDVGPARGGPAPG